MERADVAVCLISPDFLASHFCVKEEVPYLLERCETDGLVFIPLLLRPCTWKAFDWLKARQMLPRDGKTVAIDFKDSWDAVFAEVANQIFELADDLQTKSFSLPSSAPPRWSPPDKIDIARLPITGSDLFGRQQELALLDEAWDAANTNVVSFVAWGGVGKSTLVNKWLERLAKDNYRGARRVYAWSFYSQGTSERATSADLFIKEALAWFGDPDPTMGSPWDKGERLAKLVRSAKTLLVLDGMEPLQSGLASELGKIKDPALATLVTELARANDGLCLITTREQIADLDESAFVVPPLGGSGVAESNVVAESSRLKAGLQTTVQQINLELLSPEAGRALLRVGGVRGTDAELEQATADFGRHALALHLLAAYLQDSPGHHISAAARIPAPDAPAAPEQHVRRLLAAFAEKFGDGPELNVLRLLGLFDRPAEGASIKALRQAPKLAGLTDHIGAEAEVNWLQAVQRLRKYKIIAAESHHTTDELDAHPLVREHFRDQLEAQYFDAWCKAHKRLYEYLTSKVGEFPRTADELFTLYDAIAHGCKAGMFQEAWDLYEKKIKIKENESRKFGSTSADLASLFSFFRQHSSQPSRHLDQLTRASLLAHVGNQLFTLGRLMEAEQFLVAASEAHVELENWPEVVRCSNSLSALHRNLGRLSRAYQQALKSVELVERNGLSAYWRMSSLSTLATVLFQMGRRSEAEDYFGDAVEAHRECERSSQMPFLYGMAGWHYCDLLLDLGSYEAVKKRANRTLRRARGKGFRDVALDYLSLGWAYLLQTLEKEAGDFSEAKDFLEKAVEGLRRAETQHHLSRGLLARAAFYRLAGDYTHAQADLTEAQHIAERGEMGLHLADCHLEWARLCLATGKREQAHTHWAQAQAMIARMGYHRRDKDVAEIEQQLLAG
jgi:tetratricopeptide (TPR) repeat protein